VELLRLALLFLDTERAPAAFRGHGLRLAAIGQVKHLVDDETAADFDSYRFDQ
jgi:hypothetical protein